MISYLKGKIINKSKGYIIIETVGVGYQVFVAPSFFADLALKSEVEIYTHQQVREDALDLYGFKNIEGLEFFELLLTISGIGPKSALGVLSVASIEDIKESIARGDSALLTKVSGIGRKTAERVVLELREKIGKLADGNRVGTQNFASDEIDALMALGYSMPQAREALKLVDPKIKDSGERIREALKTIGR
ncbi:MAG: Holliday junction branch migration protein RuvA [Patescibacteria group bacterium]|nr:Holliday junction branch migration protein RuvA [Patescibacteria group bacterium]MDD4611342.1 Holliday junction branch migration protein RuvA [Patescibacteria group bacterium]